MTAAALLRGTAQEQRPANTQGGFSVFAVDLGPGLGAGRRAPHHRGPTRQPGKYFLVLYFFLLFFPSSLAWSEGSVRGCFTVKSEFHRPGGVVGLQRRQTLASKLTAAVAPRCPPPFPP